MIAGSTFRIGRWVLLVEGIAVGVFGGAGLAWSMANPQFGADGAPMLWLRVTPIHCGLMLGIGALTIFAALGRIAVLFSRIAVIGWLILAALCAAATARSTPGPLGFDVRDVVLYAVLALYNFVLVLWFALSRRGDHRISRPPRPRPAVAPPTPRSAHQHPDTVNH